MELISKLKKHVRQSAVVYNYSYSCSRPAQSGRLIIPDAATERRGYNY